MGSIVKFRVRMGASFAENPVLLVNLPEKNHSEMDEESKEALVELLNLQPTAAKPVIESASIGGSGDTISTKASEK